MSLPFGTGPVTGLRVAPDGVRIVLVVGTGPEAYLQLGAIVRGGGAFSISRLVPLAPGLAGPSAVTWYDEDHVLAITQPGLGARLWEVPVNGDQPTPQSAQPGMVSVTAAGPQNPLYRGMSAGRLENAVGLGEPWRDVMAGGYATYPG